MYDPTKPYKKQILEIAGLTYNSPYAKAKKGVYTQVKKKFPYMFYPDISHPDGIGTKGIYHWQHKTFRNAALDALAMNLNDIILERATPYKLDDTIKIPEDDHRAIIEIVETISEECTKRGIILSGGETSIHNNSNEVDIIIDVTGFVRKPKPNQFKIGDVLIGIASSGLHSNGFTKVREVFGDEFRPEFVEPTRIYLDDVLRLERKYDIHGMMHITGGAFTKLKDILKGADAHIYNGHMLEPQPIFHELNKRGVSDEEMYRTFNCGIGFVLGVPKKQADNLIDDISIAFDEADIIGEVMPGNGKVSIDSMFSERRVEY